MSINYSETIITPVVSDFRGLIAGKKRKISDENIQKIVKNCKGILQPELSSENLEKLHAAGFQHNVEKNSAKMAILLRSKKALEAKINDVEKQQKAKIDNVNSKNNRNIQLLDFLSGKFYGDFMNANILDQITKEYQKRRNDGLSEYENEKRKLQYQISAVKHKIIDQRNALFAYSQFDNSELYSLNSQYDKLINDERMFNVEMSDELNELHSFVDLLGKKPLFKINWKEIYEIHNQNTRKEIENIIQKSHNLVEEYKIEMAEIDAKIAELKKEDLRFIITDYTTATYVKSMQDRINLFEQYHKKGIAMVAAAKLVDDLDAETTQFNLTIYDIAMSTQKGKLGHHGIPIVKSQTDGLTSAPFETTGYNYVFWIRIDDELMKVLEWEPNDDNMTGTITVLRGIDNSGAISHAKNSVVSSPIYEGSNNEISAFPVANYNRIHYGLDIDVDNVLGFQYKSDRIVTAVELGYDGISMDLLTTKRKYPWGHCDCFGRAATPWNHKTNKLQSVSNRAQGFQVMMKTTTEYVKGKTGKIVYINGNEAEEYLLVKKYLNPYPLGSTISENAFPMVDSWWNKYKNQLIEWGKNDYPARVIIGPAKWTMSKGKFDSLFYFSYCEYLLFKGVNAKNFLIGCCFNQYNSIDAATSDVYFPRFLYIPIGEPIGEIIEIEKAYRRDYENAVILVYPYKNGDDINIIMDETYIDAWSENKVKEITLKPNSSMLLVKI